MGKDNKPLVSADELEALIQDWGANPHLSIDRFFPVRFWLLFTLVLSVSTWLLFKANALALTLTTDPEYIQRLSNFLYFRGWFMLTILVIGCYSYFRDWYVGIVFSALLLMGGVNLVFDLFTIYPERLEKPTPMFTVLLLVRISALWMLYVTVKNSSRLPPLRDRVNILLPFKRLP
jgi:phosphoglycerol transferase MdoB-like AlkP superfamily enzyme